MNKLIIITLWTIFMLCHALEKHAIRDQCHKECLNGLNSEINNGVLEMGCDEQCKTEKCKFGCDTWSNSQNTNCSHKCNDSYASSTAQVYHCSIGCHYAVVSYLKEFKDEIGTPPAPQLVAKTKSHSSVELQWESIENSNITFLVQCKYANLPSNWEYCDGIPVDDSKNTKMKVVNLKPYTSYRFRVAWIILQNEEPIMSSESLEISTTAHGPPESSPEISGVTALGPTTVSIMWNKPLFPNGQIIAYLLNVQNIKSYESWSKEISDLKDSNFYIWNDLEPDTEYEFSVQARNNIGVGLASYKLLKTPNLETDIESIDPYQIYSGRDKVFKQKLSLFSQSKEIYHSQNSSVVINGLGLHVKKDLLFVSDSEGNIHRISLADELYSRQTIMKNSGISPKALSVDWLNNKLYMAGANQICRCDLDGKGFQVVISGVDSQITDIHVDPYNGFLYWAIHGLPNGGIYQIDLAELGKVYRHQRDAHKLLKNFYLKSFAIDLKKFRILYPDEAKNTIMSLSLYGEPNILDVRANTQFPSFFNISSLALYKDLFYWTAGLNHVSEQYHEDEKKYYQLSLAYSKDLYLSRILINHPDSQPYPVPLTQVTKVQAIFGTNMAKISWAKPTLLRGLGNGAWQDWKYEIWVTGNPRRITMYRSNITNHHYNFYKLKESTKYSIKVLAYSTGGKGPWSDTFVGETFRRESNKDYPYMLWSSQGGLVRANIVGDQVESLVSFQSLKNSVVTDIAQYKNTLFLATNTSQVFSYNSQSIAPLRQIESIKSATSISFDWIGQKIYWSDAEQQMVSRCNADGSVVERLPLMVVAKKIAVDSLNAFLYWISPHAVECSRLNGEDRTSYFSIGLFSGKQLMGLSLDFDHKKVYWMLRSHAGAILYSDDMADGSKRSMRNPQIISSMPINNIIGPICYLSNRLYWLHDVRGIVISDLSGQSISFVHSYGTKGPKAVAVIEEKSHLYPDGYNSSTISVIPNQVNASSIRILGTWNNFNITWKEIENSNYGKLQYHVIMRVENNVQDKLTEENAFVYSNMKLLRPYSEIEMVIQGITFWGSSRKVTKRLRTPMSVPSSPRKPRVFVRFVKNLIGSSKIMDVVSEFRWSKPVNSNGIILGYKVSCWMLNSNRQKLFVFNDRLISPSENRMIIRDLKRNTSYSFEVKAFTAIGNGPAASTVIDTFQENHVPLLLVATSTSVEFTDIDNNEESDVSTLVNKPVDVAYHNQEKLTFWLDNMLGLMMINMTDKKSQKIANIVDKGSSLCIDWIGRYLYWSEFSSSGSVIKKLNIDMMKRNRYPLVEADKVLHSSHQIASLQVNPFSGKLIWSELQSDGRSSIRISNIDGSDERKFFWYDYVRSKREITSRNNCNCVNKPVHASSLTLDWSSSAQEPSVVWAEIDTGDIWSTDMNGCHCTLLVNSTHASNSGLPPTSVTLDDRNIYWSNKTVGKLFILKRKKFKRSVIPGHKIMDLRKPTLMISSTNIPGIQAIKASGSQLQPYPDLRCLVPKIKKKSTFLKHSSYSITLSLPNVEVDENECGNITKASVKYIVYYRLYDGSMESCQPYAMHPHNTCHQITSFDQQVTVRNLQPYKNYTFQVAALNLYSTNKPHIGPVAIFQTSIGAHSAPGNIMATPLSPYDIKVQWTKPKVLSSPSVYYEVFYSNENEKVFHNELENSWKVHENGRYETIISDLHPSQHYLVKVRVYAADQTIFTDSDSVEIETYDEPGNITQLEVTPNKLVCQWTSPNSDHILRHSFQYKEKLSNEWVDLGFQATKSATKYNYTIRNLIPKSSYYTRLVIRYSSNHSFYWPSKHEVTFLTLGDKPSIPSSPLVKKIARDVFQVEWSESNLHGGDQLYYVLEYMTVNDETKLPEIEMWSTVYNGSDKIWIIENLTLSQSYTFRVAAVNNYGMSEFSSPSDVYYLPSLTVLAQDNNTNEIALGSAVAIVVIVIVITVFLFVHRKHLHEKELKQAQIRTIRGPDLELATLRELPNQGNFIHQNNTLYAVDDIPTDEELALLPQIRRDQIDLSNLLGSGAFGEVYEGITQNMFGSDSDNTRVAIKTLRKGATDQEKAEFLKEAKLMSNFKHEHIISILGLCLDNDPNFIIIELMEGGDLLSYLRTNRPTAFKPVTLTIQDVISISVDVAKGCKHLEEMHFVHRDLAARNCLVSSHNPLQRIVKIGDFGLARDVYKNDYYRKEGEGLLPVRWMAPESLIDGIFTSQSDIWAFGVLLWEVMTLGQQPYPARTNLEVLHFVREGGRLDKPDNCPDDLHQIMLRCWSYDPEDRPAFKLCLELLEELKRKSADTPLSIVHNNHYIGRSFGDESYKQSSAESKLSLPLLKRHSDTISVHSNPSRFPNLTNEIDGVKRAISCDPCTFQELHVQLPEERKKRWSTAANGHTDDPPKYLELVQEDFNPIDGYEVPLPAQRNKDLSREIAGVLRSSGRKPAAKPPPLNYSELKQSSSLKSLDDEASTSAYPKNCNLYRYGKPLKTPESGDSIFTSSPSTLSSDASGSPLTSAVNKFFNSDYGHKKSCVSESTGYFSSPSSRCSTPGDSFSGKNGNNANSGISSLSSLSGLSVVDVDFDQNASFC